MHFASPKKGTLIFFFRRHSVQQSQVDEECHSVSPLSHTPQMVHSRSSLPNFLSFSPFPRPLKKDTKWVKSPSSSRGEKRRGDDRRNPPLFAPQRLFSSPSTRLPPPFPSLVLSPFVPSGRLIMCTLSTPPPPFKGPRPLPLQSLFPGGKVMQQVGA